MGQLYGAAIDFVQPFFEAQYRVDPVPTYWHVSLEEGVVSTGCGPATTEDAFYCPADDTIYLGEDMLWSIYSEIAGDAGVALALAHEYGHFLQDRFGVPRPVTARETIPYENQADCVAGAWAAWADGQGYFTPGDDEEIVRTLVAIASTEGPDRDHGLDRERIEAFSLGLDGTLFKCNEYYSATPLVTTA